LNHQNADSGIPLDSIRSATALALKIRDPKARADIEDNYRKTIGQALGGVAVLLGAGSAYLQFWQQQRASHDLLISNQVSKGFEQLGSKELPPWIRKRYTQRVTVGGWGTPPLIREALEERHSSSPLWRRADWSRLCPLQNRHPT
jgi:hypothetical protein